MLLLIAGGIASGKSDYASRWAMSLAREAILLSCPAFPGDGRGPQGFPSPEAMARTGFSLTEMPADAGLADTLNLINRESNIFRADRRVIVLDSLSGWLRARVRQAKLQGLEPADGAGTGSGGLRDVLDALLSFQGKRVVVTEEAAVGLGEDPWERWYASGLAGAIRELAEESHAVYRLTAGMAVQLKGQRVKRGIPKDEHLYPNGR